jgi:hypothetical protein
MISFKVRYRRKDRDASLEEQAALSLRMRSDWMFVLYSIDGEDAAFGSDSKLQSISATSKKLQLHHRTLRRGGRGHIKQASPSDLPSK